MYIRLHFLSHQHCSSSALSLNLVETGGERGSLGKCTWPLHPTATLHWEFGKDSPLHPQPYKSSVF